MSSRNLLSAKKKGLAYLVFSFLLIISACSTANVQFTPTVQPSTPTLTPTIISPTDTSTVAPTMTVNQECWKVKPITEAKTEIAGSFVYYDAELKRSMFLDISSLKTKKTLSDFSYNSSVISPDGSTFADIDYEKNKLTVTSAIGSMSFSVPDDAYFGGFLSNDRIWLLVSRAVLHNYVEGVGTTGEYYILSLLTGELASYSVKLPNFRADDHPTTHNTSYLKYSPDLNYALYSTNASNGWNILLNLKTSEIVWSGGDPDYGSIGVAQPAWKPDSSAFTIISLSDDSKYYANFHNVYIDGEDVQITHLEQVLGESYFLNTPYWSHNSRYLAFTANSDSGLTLFIFDSQTNTLIDPCVTENPDESFRIWIPLFWSPASDKLALTWGGKARWEWIDPSKDKAKFVQETPPDVLIIDLTDRVIYKMPSSISLSGWLSWEIP